MRIKFVQVNIYLGKYLDNLVDFIKKVNPDFIAMQEVSSNNFNACADKSLKLVDFLKKELSMHAVFNGDVHLDGDYDSLFGNAVFSKLPIEKHEIIKLKSFRPVTLTEVHGNFPEVFEQYPKHVLDATVKVDDKHLRVLSWHGAWTAPPHDTPETLRQAEIVRDHLRSITAPFILGADTNNIAGSKTINKIEEASVNLLKDFNLDNSLSQAHRIAPEKLLIDFVFASRNIKAVKIEIPEVTVSDHLPVVAELEIP